MKYVYGIAVVIERDTDDHVAANDSLDIARITAAARQACPPGDTILDVFVNVRLPDEKGKK